MLTHIIRDTTLKILNALPHHSILILAAKWCRTPMRVYPLNPVSANNPCCLLLYAHLGYFLKCYNSIWGRMKKKNSLFSFLITVSADNSGKKTYQFKWSCYCQTFTLFIMTNGWVYTFTVSLHFHFAYFY